MRSPTDARHVLTVALALALAAAAHAENDADPRPAESTAGQILPWACFLVSVAALGAMYVFVRHREQATEADLRRGVRPPAVWYCAGPATGTW